MIRRLLESKKGKITTNIFQNIIENSNIMSTNKYEEAVDLINSLQSNTSYVKNVVKKGILTHSAIHSTTIAETKKYLLRVGVSLEQLDKLSVIHVAGTKGKGSTCAFCESILRHHGYKTGFYSSPHLVNIRERIQLNGKPIDEDYFSRNVIEMYNKLLEKKENVNDMPLYFRFLTILAFKIFLLEKVDVAIIEVGIGGEYDCTNILRNTPVVGISSLGLEHINLLGNSIEKIAWQKSGIMKKNSQAFTTEQTHTAMEILKQRSIEKECSIKTVPNYDDYVWQGVKPVLGINGKVQKINASLAIQLAHCWMRKCGKNTNLPTLSSEVPEITKIALEQCKWPGRYQILKIPNANVYLDGAHTVASVELCAEWFKNNANSSNKVLLFNMIGERDCEQLLKCLQTIDFTHVIFVPNVGSTSKIIKDQLDVRKTEENYLNQCEQYKNIWLKIQESNEVKNPFQAVSVFPSIDEAIKSLPNDKPSDILITGSLYLVGAALYMFDPDLNTC